MIELAVVMQTDITCLERDYIVNTKSKGLARVTKSSKSNVSCMIKKKYLNRVKSQTMKEAKSKVKFKRQLLRLVRQEQILKKSTKPDSWAKSIKSAVTSK